MATDIKCFEPVLPVYTICVNEKENTYETCEIESESVDEFEWAKVLAAARKGFKFSLKTETTETIGNKKERLWRNFKEGKISFRELNKEMKGII